MMIFDSRSKDFRFVAGENRDDALSTAFRDSILLANEVEHPNSVTFEYYGKNISIGGAIRRVHLRLATGKRTTLFSLSAPKTGTVRDARISVYIRVGDAIVTALVLILTTAKSKQDHFKTKANLLGWSDRTGAADRICTEHTFGLNAEAKEESP